jgi:hypothetical protein
MPEVSGTTGLCVSGLLAASDMSEEPVEAVYVLFKFQLLGVGPENSGRFVDPIMM